METNSIVFTVLFLVFAGSVGLLALANAALLIMRFAHSENSRLARSIREFGRHLSFFRLGGKNQHDLRDHA